MPVLGAETRKLTVLDELMFADESALVAEA